MEAAAAAAAAAATSLFSSSSAYSNKPKLTHNCIQSSSSPWNPYYALGKCCGVLKFIPQKSSLLVSFRTSALAAVGEILEKSSTDDPASSSSSSSVPASRDSLLPKIDKSGRFCSPRAARELALSIIYAACLEGSDPVRLFEKRINARREIGYEFDKASLMEYNHMSFGGPPVTTRTVEEAEQLLCIDQIASEIGNLSLSNSGLGLTSACVSSSPFIMPKRRSFFATNSSNMFIGGEAEVLSAPPKLVYSKLILRFTRKLLVAVAEKWDSNALAIEKVAPPNWKSAPAGRILELSILHLAMSEIAVLGTRHQIVINEAVDLAKRFCDGAAPRIVNGCLRTFVKDLEGSSSVRDLETNLAAPAAELQN